MSLINELKSLAKKRNTRECEFLGKTLLVRVYSKKAWKDVWSKFIDSIEADPSEGRAEVLLAEQFLDPKTGKQAITKEMLEDDFSQADVQDLTILFLRMNSADSQALERAEKN